MNYAYYPAILELQNPTISSPFYAKKGDTGRKLQFILTDNGEPYTICDDCYAVFTAKKPDGNIIYNDCTIENNTIVYTFSPQTCTAAGNVGCEVRLYDADNRLIVSPTFTLIVEDTVYSDGDVVESTPEASALTALLQHATELVDDVEKKLADNAYADAHSAVCFTSQNLLDTQKQQARSNIAAAPSGFGLGTPAAITNDPDTITATGFYAVSNSDIMPNSHWWMGWHIHFRDAGYDYQWFYDLQTGSVVRRYNYAGQWQEWEWENPRMILGSEYRTTERWNGKPVYTKLLNVGTLPNCTYKDIAVDVQMTTLVDLRITASTSELACKIIGTCESDIYASVRWGNTLRIYALASDYSAYTGQALIKYTKD